MYNLNQPDDHDIPQDAESLVDVSTYRTDPAQILVRARTARLHCFQKRFEMLSLCSVTSPTLDQSSSDRVHL